MVQEFLNNDNSILLTDENLNCSGITHLKTEITKENFAVVGFPGSGNTLLWSVLWRMVAHFFTRFNLLCLISGIYLRCSLELRQDQSCTKVRGWRIDLEFLYLWFCTIVEGVLLATFLHHTVQTSSKIQILKSFGRYEFEPLLLSLIYKQALDA